MTAPLSRNIDGIGIRIVEATFGHDHFQNFKDFLARGGIQGTLKESGLPINLEHSSVFWKNCREAIMVSAQQQVVLPKREYISAGHRDGHPTK